jgi:aminopeptidase
MPIDLRTQQLAKLIVDYSVFVKKGEKVIISGAEEAKDFVVALYKEVILRGAHPILRFRPSGLSAFFYKYANKEQLKKFPKEFDYAVKNAQKYIGISTSDNTRALTSSNPKKLTARQEVMKPIVDHICNEKPKIYRCTVGFPCMALAQEAEMDIIEYENFFYSSCLQNWRKLNKKMNKIANKFRKGKKVHLIGENVDLKFEIHGDKLVIDDGKENMPGGEIFMAPVRESLQGWIKFEYPAIRNGKEVSGIFLKFENGKVIESKADKNESFLKEMLETDENSSYVGEFGIGMNPEINKFTKQLLFDEKIGGTIHLALGMAYKENGGGNDSAIHWDIVKDMKKSKIILDGKVVQDKGKWKI